MEKVTFATKIGLALPSAPVDRFTIRWWVFDTHSCSVRERQAIYHVNRTCFDVFGTDGTPLVDDWAVYEHDIVTSRWTGWDAPQRHVDYYLRSFATEDEAVQCLILHALEKRDRLMAELVEIEDTLRKYGSLVSPP